MVKRRLLLRAMSIPGVRWFVAVRLSQPAADFHNRGGYAAAAAAPDALPPRVAMSHSRGNRACRWPVMSGEIRCMDFAARWHGWPHSRCWLAAARRRRRRTYPDRPVKIIVPIGPGGSYDLVGRHLADVLVQAHGAGLCGREQARRRHRRRNAGRKPERAGRLYADGRRALQHGLQLGAVFQARLRSR